MWLYSQSSGKLWDGRGLCVAHGYSGFGEGKNKPELQGTAFKGPIPRGTWVIGMAYDSSNVGPLAIPLTPHKHNAMFRTDFLIHGDSISDPGNASRGCIIMNRSMREKMIASDDKLLRVIE